MKLHCERCPGKFTTQAKLIEHKCPSGKSGIIATLRGSDWRNDPDDLRTITVQ